MLSDLAASARVFSAPCRANRRVVSVSRDLQAKWPARLGDMTASGQVPFGIGTSGNGNHENLKGRDCVFTRTLRAGFHIDRRAGPPRAQEPDQELPWAIQTRLQRRLSRRGRHRSAPSHPPGRPDHRQKPTLTGRHGAARTRSRTPAASVADSSVALPSGSSSTF